MKSRFILLGIFATLILGICSFFISCDKGINDIVIYRGQVVYLNTSNPFPDLLVKVTDGTNTHCQTQTDESGLFELKVRINEINGSYYLLAGDATCVPKKVALGGYGQAEVDLGVIEVEGPSLPVVVTNPILSVSADAAILGGEVKSDGRLSVTARGICYSTNQYPTIEGLHTIDGTGVGVFNSELKGLQHNMVYYARAYATNSLGTAYDSIQIKFTTEEGVPVVTTDTITQVTAHSARCKGRVESDGGYPVTRRGTCWSKNPDPTIDDTFTADGSGVGEFTSELRDLVENTTYYVRAYAVNSTATVYGEQMVITTLDGMPEVITDSISDISATSFMAYGNVVSDCGIPVAERGFCYSTKQTPTINDKRVAVNKGLGTFQSRINDLEASTTYYVRAYATNATGTTYGDQLSVLTLDGYAVVRTDSVNNVTSKSVTAFGTVVSDCDVPVTERGFCYATTQYPSIEDQHLAVGKGLGKFNGTIGDLEKASVYYVRAYATNSYGTKYGEQIKITTLDGMAKVTTDSVSQVTAKSFVVYGNVTFDCYLPITSRGFCYAKTQYPTIENDNVSVGKTTGKYESTISNLEIKTTYYVRAFVTNANGTSYGEQIAVTTLDGLPVVSTLSVSTMSSVIEAGGNVISDGGFAVTSRGVCYSAMNSSPTLSDSYIEKGSGTGKYSVTISDVQLQTTYYVRAYATNSVGTAYGEPISIETGTGLPTVETKDPRESDMVLTSPQSIVIYGKVTTAYSGQSVSERGIVYATYQNPTIENGMKESCGSGSGEFYASISNINLEMNTYYFRAYAINENGIVYGDDVKVSPDTYTYLKLKTMNYGGYTYRIKCFEAEYDESWNVANARCENYVLGGYSDWYMPDKDEATAILQAYGVYGKRGSLNELAIEKLYTIHTSTESQYEISIGHYYTHYMYMLLHQGDLTYIWELIGGSDNCCPGNEEYNTIAVRKYHSTQSGSGEVTPTAYYIKHSWGSGLDEGWEWKKMNKEGDYYTYTGAWGGIGANINTTASDAGAQWFPVADIEKGDHWSIGDMVTFVYNPMNGKLSTR